MEITKSIKELERELKSKKKLLDKLQKKMRKCTSSFQYENMIDDAEILSEDIVLLQYTIQEEQRKRKEEKLISEEI